MTIREIVKCSGLTQRQFAYIYKIPLRTLENWVGGVKLPKNDYIFYLLERCVLHDKHKGEYPLRIAERQAEDARNQNLSEQKIIDNRFL